MAVCARTHPDTPTHTQPTQFIPTQSLQSRPHHAREAVRKNSRRESDWEGSIWIEFGLLVLNLKALTNFTLGHLYMVGMAL